MKLDKYRATAAVVALPAILFLVLAGSAQAAPASNPAGQFGEIHSCTTNGAQTDITYNGGQEWFYTGGPPGGTPSFQVGVVHSFTTGGNANVTTGDGGVTWYFDNTSPLFCSAP
jgi:hypothetical protein